MLQLYQFVFFFKTSSLNNLYSISTETCSALSIRLMRLIYQAINWQQSALARFTATTLKACTNRWASHASKKTKCAKTWCKHDMEQFRHDASALSLTLGKIVFIEVYFIFRLNASNRKHSKEKYMFRLELKRSQSDYLIWSLICQVFSCFILTVIF